jgi:tRNA 2-thiocytidine biosynthesis protein TtcA
MAKIPGEVESQKLFKKICRKVGTTIRDHSMIAEGDHVLVGLSGGKDSMILLESLAERRKALPFDFRLTAAHVEAAGIGYRIDKEKLDEFCMGLGVPLHYLSIAPDFDKDPSKNTCFICSWHRRKKLFDLTRQLDCNRLALGHHRKDAIETLLLNMIYHGSISSLPYTLRMFDGRIKLIRPLMDLEEGLLTDYALLNDRVQVEKSCPHENRTQRQSIARLVGEIESMHPTGPYNIFKSMDKIFTEYLPQKYKEGY